MTLTDTIQWARSIPRSARLAQGHPRIRDFALHVMRVRAARADRRRMRPNPIRTAIVRRLQRIVDDQLVLRRAARAEAGLCAHDSAPVTVVYAPREAGAPLAASRLRPASRGRGYIKYHWANGPARGTVYHPSTRHVSTPAAWVLGRIREMTRA
jgi:hypothetical protein